MKSEDLEQLLAGVDQDKVKTLMKIIRAVVR